MKSKRKVQHVKLATPPKLPDLPDIQLGGVQLGQGKARIKVPPNQTQFEDMDVWGWWMAAFPESSFIEYLCMEALVKLGLKMIDCPRSSWRGDDVLFQKNSLVDGAFLLPGVFNRTVVDFLVLSQYPYVALFPDGYFWHQGQVALDVSKRTQLKQYTGWTVRTIDDNHMLLNARYYVSEALQDRGYSHLAQYGL